MGPFSNKKKGGDCTCSWVMIDGSNSPSFKGCTSSDIYINDNLS